MSVIFNVSTDYLFDNEVVSTAPVYHLAGEEFRLLDGYRTLNTTNKNLIMNLINQLNFSRTSIEIKAAI